MPITPRFTLTQSETSVVVEISVPHVRVSIQSVEIVVVDESVFHFSSPPYLLVLTFPKPLVDQENGDAGPSAKYDPSKNGGTIAVTLQKRHPEIWKDLDLLGNLMRPKQQASSRPGSISILSSSQNEQNLQDESDPDQDDSSSVEREGNVPSHGRHALLPHYGFCNMFTNVFTDLAREGLAGEMLQLPDPDTIPAQDRRPLRFQREKTDFDVERYLGDLQVQEDYIYQEAMSMIPHWIKEQQQNDHLQQTASTAAIESTNDVNTLAQQVSQLSTKESSGESTTPQHQIDSSAATITVSKSYFTADETQQLASIPYPLLPQQISSQQQRSLFYGLLDILFAYVYDYLLTQGDPTVESSWTTCTLSCTLSWLEDYNPQRDTLQDVLRNSIRRSLIYPYLRNYGLACYCWKNVLSIAQNGKRCIIRCLLQVRKILDKSECHYLGNRLHVDPYLLWIQQRVNSQSIEKITGELESQLSHKQCRLDKDSLGLDLVELERMVLEEGEESERSEISSNETDGSSSTNEQDSSDTDSTESSPTSKPELHNESSLANDGFSNSNLQSETRATKNVQTHSTDLLDSELALLSSDDGLDSTVANLLTSNATNSEPEGIPDKDSPMKRPLIEEL